MSLSSLKGNLIGYDTETTGLNPWGTYGLYGFYPSRPFAFSFCDQYENTAYVRWEVDPKTREVIPERKSLRAMSEILSDPDIVKIGHNLMFDIRMSRKSGIKFNWKNIHDTQILSHIYTGGSLRQYGLKPLCKEFFNMNDDDQKDLLKSVQKGRREAKKKGWCIATKETHGKEPLKADYWLGDRKLCKEYAILDAKRTLGIFLMLHPELLTIPEMVAIYAKELRLAKLIYRTEKTGIKVFKDHLKDLKIFYKSYSEEWLKRAHKRGGKDLNFKSPKQMVKKFCDEKGYTTAKYSKKTGAPSIDNDELCRLAKKDKLAKAILEHKAGESMLTKFIKPYEKYMVKENNIWTLHPNLKQTGTVTGRFSCSDPNLLGVAAEDNANKKADIGLKPREALGPRKGYMWYLPDYSQMEVWIFGFKAQDKIMMNALLSGEDFHAITGKHCWGQMPDWEENKKLYRKKGKTMMFLKQYGGGVGAASDLLGCNRKKALETIRQFDERLPGVSDFVQEMMEEASDSEYICNAFGRRYLIPEGLEYKAVNYYVQGTCADIMKNAMLKLEYLFRTKWIGCKILLPLHDELILEIPLQLHCKELQKDIIRIMQKDSALVGIPVKLPISMKYTTTRWSDAKE